MLNIHIPNDKQASLVLEYLHYLADTNRPALERVREAEHWCRNAWKSRDCRCLIGHAADYHEGQTADPGCFGFRDESALLFPYRRGVEIAFDALCRDHGISAVVAAIQAEAGRLLDVMPPSQRAAARTTSKLRELAEVSP